MRLTYLKFVNFSLVVLMGLAIPVTVVLLTNAGLQIFTRDVFSFTKSSPVLGFLSNVGAFVWCSALSVIVLTIFTKRHNNIITSRGFLYYSAFLTG